MSVILNVDIVSDDVIYQNAAGTARVEKLVYSDGTEEYGVWLKEGSTALDHLVCACRIPQFDDEGLAFKIADSESDGGWIATFYRTEGF